MGPSIELVFDPDGPVLGIDPGLTRCGYGAVRPGADGPVAVASGVLRTDPSDELPARLATLHEDVRALVAELRPCAVAVERLLFQHNVRTAVAVGQASGVVLTVAAQVGIPVTHYSPNEVKLAVAGDGTADKGAVQDMVARVLRLAVRPEPPDAADALALALCHAWHTPLRDAVGAAPASQGRLGAAIERALARDSA